ncbi:MAG: PrsW family intramembrane metalloprotease [Synechococcales cyanobacterium C42_A2020_086]|jgi:RsiW-degrading membrane proteinase PrsW (M82 family)|nr:PrsW family intramembrane metalloprotease [Synechococcales cyanobacterium C42_A2020_086]
MTGSSSYPALLRRITSPNQADPGPATYPLTAATTLLIGRDPRCQIVLDSQQHGAVSRQHVRISPSPMSPSGWEVCDLNSANGTYVNGQRLQGCVPLRSGDAITLSQNGPQFVFELRALSPVPNFPAPPPSTEPDPPPAIAASTRPPRVTPASPPPPDGVTLSQLFPILSTGRDLTRKAYLVPGIFTVSFVVLMFFSIGNPILFNLLLAFYIAGIAFYFVYQLCGKPKPWWLLVCSALLTMVLLISPVLLIFLFVFRGILPGNIPDDNSAGLLRTFVQMFFGAGLMEELLKAIPVLLAYWIGARLRSPHRERIGVWEPLDGILLGTASAVGFTLLETLGQYVPGVVNDVTLQAGTESLGQLVGLQLLIPRILGSISGHMAYSGYFGYFIGLSVLKPARRWRILTVGYLTASLLHALWNTTGLLNLGVTAVVGVVSYAFLTAAILQARKLSPTRDQNFATRFTRLP